MKVVILTDGLGAFLKNIAASEENHGKCNRSCIQY